MIKLNFKSKRLLLLQRNELLSDKQKFLRKKFGRLIFTNFFINFFQKKNLQTLAEELFKREYNIINEFLPKKALNVMDIGCGLGLINIFINKAYSGRANFYLLDKNRVDKKIKYGFSKNYESYNSLTETKNILIHNGLSEKNINIYDVEKGVHINKKIDLVISLKSMGYHYPLECYLKLFSTCCDRETIFIFDISEGDGNIDLLKKYFEKVHTFYEEPGIHPLKRL